MRDESTRALERQAQSGLDADLAPWLHARVRSGDPYRCGDLTTCLPLVYRSAEALRAGSGHQLVLTPRRNRVEGMLSGRRVMTLVLESRPESEIERDLFGVAGEVPAALSSSGTLILEGPLFHQAWQARLAEAIRSKSFRPHRAPDPEPCEVHLILATRSEDGLRPELEELLGAALILPPLVERIEDLELELESLLPERVELTTSAWDILRGYPWTGNRVELSAFATRLIQLTPHGELASDELTRGALKSALPLWHGP